MQYKILAKTALTSALIFVCLSLLVGTMGPFGTFSALSTGERYLYWFICIAVIGLQTLGIIISMFLLPLTRNWHRFKVVTFACVLASFPASFEVLWLNQQMMQGANLPGITQLYLFILILNLSINLPLSKKTYQGYIIDTGLAVNLTDNTVLTDSEIKENNAADVEALTLSDQTNKSGQTQDYRQLLDVDIKGELLCITAEDHYIKIHSTEESKLILYRFSDAVKRLESISGLKVHRSWWVSKDAVEKCQRVDGKMTLQLKNAMTVPVSRTNIQKVNDMFCD